MKKISCAVNRVNHPLVLGAAIDVLRHLFAVNVMTLIFLLNRANQKIAHRDVRIGHQVPQVRLAAVRHPGIEVFFGELAGFANKLFEKSVHRKLGSMVTKPRQKIKLG